MTLAYRGNAPGLLPSLVLLDYHWRQLNLRLQICNRCVSMKCWGENIVYKLNSTWNADSMLFRGLNCNCTLTLLYIKWAHLIIFLLLWQELHLSLAYNAESSICPIKILWKFLPFIFMTLTSAQGKLGFSLIVLPLQVICLCGFLLLHG